MRKQLLSGVSVAALLIGLSSAPVLLAGPADAADLGRPVYKTPPPAPAPVYSWTGCYVGAHVGWGWGHNNATTNSFSFGVNHISGGTGVNTSGALFGGQLGCNYQFAGNWVAGIQGDIAGTDFNGRANDALSQIEGGAFGSTIGVKTDWLTSVTGRLGWAFWNNQALVYVKGGIAWTHNKWDLHDAALPFNPAELDETRSGWTIGGGLEWTLWSPNWTAFVEYNFYQFNGGSTFDNTFDRDVSFKTQFVTGRQEINTVKVGVNYKFNGFFGGGP